MVIIGDGSITIASEDPEALDQFESLLRTMSQRTGYAGRDFSIYAIRNTSAVGVASTLTQLFRSKTRTSIGSDSPWRRTSRLVIVPDERLNTILVQGSRTDRAKIENLLKVLDTAEVPETLAGNKPKLVPIKNTEADRIEQVIRDIFKTQLSSRSGSAALPSWLSTELSVDEVTNSLVVMAPSPLVDEIIELAERLDQAAGEDPARELKIIALKKINAERAIEALERIRTSGRSRSRRRPSAP
jgi:type II secretory pathway component GspD/PulD (secretin)